MNKTSISNHMAGFVWHWILRQLGEHQGPWLQYYFVKQFNFVRNLQTFLKSGSVFCNPSTDA